MNPKGNKSKRDKKLLKTRQVRRVLNASKEDLNSISRMKMINSSWGSGITRKDVSNNKESTLQHSIASVYFPQVIAKLEQVIAMHSSLPKEARERWLKEINEVRALLKEIQND